MNVKLKLPDDFLNEEYRDGYFVSNQMKKNWAIQLDLLAEFDRVCKKYNITYSLDSGSLLGAVRHKGFIPWDDDIDVIITRPNYNKLLDIVLNNNEFKEPYFFQCAYTDKNYVRGHAQFRNSDTTGILKSEFNCDCKFNQGIFIDIFILDGIPEDEKEKKKQNKILCKYKRLFRCYNDVFIKGETNIIKKILKIIYRKIFKRNCLILDYKNLENTLTEVYDKCKAVDKILFRLNNCKYQIPKEIFSEVVYVDFEFLKFPIIKDYDYLLKIYYGDDYRIPKKIPNCHGEVIIDTEISYVDYILKNKKGE